MKEKTLRRGLTCIEFEYNFLIHHEQEKFLVVAEKKQCVQTHVGINTRGKCMPLSVSD